MRLQLLMASLAGWIALWPPVAVAQGVVRSTFDDWELRCERRGETGEQCILYQNVADEERPELNLVIVILRVADTPAPDAPRRPVLRVIAPLGVLLPRGLGLRIESATETDAEGKPRVNDIGSTGFGKCLPAGCIAEVPMDDALIKAFSEGRTASFIIFQTPTEGRGLPVRLAGFSRGFEALR